MSTSTVSTKPTVDTNPRGIPRAPFISNIEEHVGGPDVEAESTLKQFQEAIAKYRYMEVNLTQRRKGLLEKVPDIRKTLDMVVLLKEQQGEGDGESSKPFTTSFELNDTLFAEAEIRTSDTVYLWLGANVMLSYTLQQAHELLTKKLESAERSLLNVTEDLEFLREQVTIMEVNTARVYNWDVKRRRELREAGLLVDEKTEA